MISLSLILELSSGAQPVAGSQDGAPVSLGSVYESYKFPQSTRSGWRRGVGLGEGQARWTFSQ